MINKKTLLMALLSTTFPHINTLAQDTLENKLNPPLETNSPTHKYKNDLFSKLNPDISKTMEKYPFIVIPGYGGGSWSTVMPNEIIVWDDYSDLEHVTFDGVKVDSYSPQRTIVHEYFHGIWDVYGKFSSSENRLIDRNQFRKDTERFIKDEKYKNTLLHDKLKKSWGVDNSSEKRMEELQKMFPLDFANGDQIPQVLTERFATLAEEYFQNPNLLPEYLSKHFKPFFK